ncbi:hypothetical protein [Sphingomonas crusticola]|uniref:hypothetical protein n=1 Tax=Sphingomonas crusticola TaxID=1697973 RepID=UPI0013C32169|nr:hypothetical protein [Sphingomonas crusticola]
MAERLQSILINAADGRRSIGDDNQYPNLRRELLRRVRAAPQLLTTHPTVDSFTARIKGVNGKPARVQMVRDEFSALMAALPGQDSTAVAASAWTGIESRTEKLRAVRNLLPLAQAAVEGMIVSLSDTGGNGAPLLDEREEAVGYLRQLHGTLGDLLAAAKTGHLDDELGQGLAAEAARYATRAARALRDDPMPYITSGLLHGILAVCGLPAVGSFLGGIAQNIRKNADR